MTSFWHWLKFIRQIWSHKLYRIIKTRSSAIAVIADRTACSILTLFIVTATSRPLNKKSVCCQSVDATITADLRPQSAHLCLRLQSVQALVGGRTERHRVIGDNEPTHSLSPIYTVMAFLPRF